MQNLLKHLAADLMVNHYLWISIHWKLCVGGFLILNQFLFFFMCTLLYMLRSWSNWFPNHSCFIIDNFLCDLIKRSRRIFYKIVFPTLYIHVLDIVLNCFKLFLNAYFDLVPDWSFYVLFHLATKLIYTNL